MKSHFCSRWFESLDNLNGGAWILDLLLPTTTIDGLGLPAGALLLQSDPGHHDGVGGDGAGVGFCGVELPAGKLTSSGRERVQTLHT